MVLKSCLKQLNQSHKFQRNKSPPMSNLDQAFIYVKTRELPGFALVNILTGQIFMGTGNNLNYIDILK